LQGYYATDENRNIILKDSIGGYGDATLGDGSGNYGPSWSNVLIFFFE